MSYMFVLLNKNVSNRLKDYAEQVEIAMADTIIEFDRITLNAF